MRAIESRAPWFFSVLPVLLAVPFALLISQTRPSTSLLVVAAAIPLVIAFLSPLTGLFLLVFSMLLGPEFLVGGLGSGTTLGRGLTLRLDDFLLMLVGVGWLGRVAVSGHEKVFVRTPLNRTIILYTAACIFATLIGILAGRVRPVAGTFFLLKYYEYFFLFFMTANLVKTMDQVRHLVTASLVTCALVTLYAIAQIPSGVRVSAPFEGEFGEPNTLGGYLVFMIALTSGLLVTEGAIRNKWPLVGLLGLATIALQATLSRASFLAAAVVAVIVVCHVSRRNLLLVSGLIIGLLVLPLVAPAPVIERVTHTFMQTHQEGQIQIGNVRVDTSTSERLNSWKESVAVWKKSPIWGQGVTGGPFMDAMYPRVLSETGLIGVCAFLALIAALGRSGLTVAIQATDPYLKGLALGFLFGFIGLLVHAVGANTFIIVRIMEPFWLMAALITCMYMRGQTITNSGDIPTIARQPQTTTGETC